MSINILAATKGMDRDEWLQLRRNGIGGSDVAAIAGLSKYKSPVYVYLEKIGEVKTEEVGEAAYWGTVLEDVVAKEFSLRTGLKVHRRNAILRHPDHSFMLANVDRLIAGKKEGLECKTASEWLKGEWREDEIPAAYLLQCQHYMAVTGYEAWWIAVLIGGNKFIYKRIERDEELIQQLIEMERDFWENHVIPKVPPEFDVSADSTNLLKRMYPEAMAGTEVSLPSKAGEIIEALEQVNAALKELGDQKSQFENQLKVLLTDHEVGLFKDRRVIWKNIVQNRFDSKTFEKEHPELYKKYLKPSSYRRFEIK